MQVDKARLDEMLADDEVEAAARSLCRMGTNFPSIEQTDAWVDQKWTRFVEEARLALSAAAKVRSLRSTEGKEAGSMAAAINFAEAYVAGYEFDDGDGGFHTPTEAERLVMLDMINGLFSEDGFIAALTRSPE